EPLELPVIEVQAPPDGGASLRDAAARLPKGEYDWLVLTSPNGATRLLGELHDAPDLGGVHVAAIGPGTAERVRAFHIQPGLVPPDAVAESLVDTFPAANDGGRVLLARAVVARDVLPEGLRAKGWEVDVVDAYETVPVALSDEQRELLRTADVITFTSS